MKIHFSLVVTIGRANEGLTHQHPSTSPSVSIVPFFLLLAHLVLVPQAAAVTLPIPHAERASVLRNGFEQSQYVVLATVLSLTYIAVDSVPYTVYHAPIDQMLKGSGVVLEDFSFCRHGGRIGTRVLMHPGAYPIEVGERYLLFATNCSPLPVPLIDNEHLIARIEGPVAFPNLTAGSVPTSALVDSITTCAIHVSLPYMVPNATAIIRGSILATDLDNPDRAPAHRAGSISVLVTATIKNTSPNALTTGSAVEIQIRRTDTQQDAVEGTPTVCSVGEDAVFFLEDDGPLWMLQPSTYAKWTISDDSAYVLAEIAICGGQQERVEEIPLPLLLETISE